MAPWQAFFFGGLPDDYFGSRGQNREVAIPMNKTERDEWNAARNFLLGVALGLFFLFCAYIVIGALLV